MQSAKCGVTLNTYPIIITARATWMGKISALSIFDVRKNQVIKLPLKTPFVPTKECGVPRNFKVSITCHLESTDKVETRSDGKDVHYEEHHMILVLKFAEVESDAYIYRRFKIKYELMQDEQSNVRIIFDRKKRSNIKNVANNWLKKLSAMSGTEMNMSGEAITEIEASKSKESPPTSPQGTPVTISRKILGSFDAAGDDSMQFTNPASAPVLRPDTPEALKAEPETTVDEEEDAGIKEAVTHHKFRSFSQVPTMSEYMEFEMSQKDCDLQAIISGEQRTNFMELYMKQKKENLLTNLKPNKNVFFSQRPQDMQHLNLELDEQHDVACVVSMTNIVTVAVDHTAFSWKGDDFLLGIRNELSYTHLTILNTETDTMLVFILTREHIDRSEKFKNIFNLLMSIVDTDPLMMHVLYAIPMTPDLLKENNKPSLALDKYITFVTIVRDGAVVALTDPNRQPIFNASFEVSRRS